ncbi:MAG TPA: thioredoxin domain-containing protein [Streptosporangiaceae bacterium]|nr:thioredoxin domain-containing protein [Streptosporangiaceae bacterium]
MADRLKNATSPYLLQHAGNPVDWWPWSDAAFAEARARDVPVLLSVGYSACHWCHVMAHESFEDPQTAALMNDNLVSIKVDREERPDVDAVYMTATQAMTGQGGWPMTVFMTPDREPFFTGTYFPRDYFQRLVLGVAKAWREDRSDVTGRASQVAAALAERAVPLRGPGSAEAGTLAQACDQAVRSLATDYDAVDGGFGGAPKFPPSMVLEFLLRHAERGGPGGEQALAMTTGTAEAMARGGMYDQLGGGFARYSVDAGWVVPHFEKMLYDNALLARVYTHLWRRTGSALARRVAAETCHWMLAELGTPERGLAAALDADSDGAEGLFYTWTPAELTDALGAADGEWAAQAFGVTGSGTFEHGRSVLQRRSDPSDPERLARVRGTLLARRGQRVRPGRDDKVVAAWNGLAIAALAETGLLLDEATFVAAARDAAGLLARVHLAGGRLARTSRDGVASASAGVLEDYACVAEGFLALSGVTGEARWVTLAGQLLDTTLDRFGDGAGGFFDTADDGEALVYRPADPADGPTPSGAFAAAGALLSYAALTGSERHRDAAVAALGVLGPIASQFPRAAGWGLAVAEALLSGPAEIAVVGPPGAAGTVELHRTALHAAPPGAVVALGTGLGDGPGGPAGLGGAGSPGGPGGGEGVAGIALLAGRGLVDGGPAAYVCHNFTCLAPVTGPAELRAALDTAAGNNG